MGIGSKVHDLELPFLLVVDTSSTDSSENEFMGSTFSKEDAICALFSSTWKSLHSVSIFCLKYIPNLFARSFFEEYDGSDSNMFPLCSR